MTTNLTLKHLSIYRTIRYDSYDTHTVSYYSRVLTILRYNTKLFIHDTIHIVRYVSHIVQYYISYNIDNYAYKKPINYIIVKVIINKYLRRSITRTLIIIKHCYYFYEIKEKKWWQIYACVS